MPIPPTFENSLYPRFNNYEAIQKRLEEVKCPECDSELKQTRSGGKKVKCTGCDFKGTFKAKKV